MFAIVKQGNGIYSVIQDCDENMYNATLQYLKSGMNIKKRLDYIWCILYNSDGEVLKKSFITKGCTENG